MKGLLHRLFHRSSHTPEHEEEERITRPESKDIRDEIDEIHRWEDITHRRLRRLESIVDAATQRVLDERRK